MRIYINTGDEYRLWDTLTEEERKKIGNALNDKALKAIGYLPVSEISKKHSGLSM
ncbi:MAG: hypothetical protein WCD89_26430 [Anaerocolumna sp.]